MFDSPIELLTACCAVCSTYTLLLEQAKRHHSRYGADGGQANLSLAALQSAWNILYGTLIRAWNWSRLKLSWRTGVLYTFNIWMPIFAQSAGIDSLTLLLLRASSPLFTTLMQPKKMHALTHSQWVAVLTAGVGTVLASVGTRNSNSGTWIGVVCCLLGTLSACMLSVEQKRVRDTNAISLTHLLAHMHLICGATFIPATLVVYHWVLATPIWITASSTIMQWLCSISIVFITEKRDPLASQIALTVRRALCTLLVAGIYAETATSWHWASLVCALVSSTLYEFMPLNKKEHQK